MNPHDALSLPSLEPKLRTLFRLAQHKILALDHAWGEDPTRGTPVFTIRGQYTSRGWTEWTQGFQFGLPLLAFDATGNKKLLTLARTRIRDRMAPHITHTGVHDHGFNNLSTYGTLRRLMLEGKTNPAELDFCSLALKASGAVQAARWTAIPSDPARHPATRDTGFIHSFSGPHSLFADTLRSVRSLMLAWQLDHSLMGENDRPINLLHRGLHHALATARYNVFLGTGRDLYDTPDQRGRVAHESLFNITDGHYRCPSSQQGYSPFTTWTRGLAWILLGFSEQLEFLAGIAESEFKAFPLGTKKTITKTFLEAATATADWYLAHSFADGMVYWDAGAPGIPARNQGECCQSKCCQDDSAPPQEELPITNDQLPSPPCSQACACEHSLYSAPSNPYNDHEPIDSSAAAIAAQGFYRLSKYLAKSDKPRAHRYRQAALRIAATLFDTPYLSTDPKHQGLILHSVYHRPNHWDHIPAGQTIPCGESSMWGDYHALELALLLHREIHKEPYITFFDR